MRKQIPIFEVTIEWSVGGETDRSIILEPGAILFGLMVYDYGSALMHTALGGERYISVSPDEAGDYPFYTVPARVLKPCVRS